MSTDTDILNQNNGVQSNNKSNLSEVDAIISSKKIIKNNDELKHENSLSEMNDCNINNKENFNKSQQKHKIILKSESNHNNINMNTSYSQNNSKNKSQEHDKPKLPNLIRNIHYRKDLKKNNDNFRYQPLSSFEQKLSKELCRLSNRYTIIKNRKFFSKDLENTNIYYANFPEYKIYKQLKEIETRKEVPNAFAKPRLKPLIVQNRNKLSILAKNLYEADQVERLKKFMYNQYKIKIGQ